MTETKTKGPGATRAPKAKAKKKGAARQSLSIKPIRPSRMTFWIAGTSPLLQHKWSEKGLRMLRMTAAERKKQPKVPRDAAQEGADAAYLTGAGEYGLSILAFKSALIGAAHKDFGVEKTLVKKAFFVPTDDKNMCVPLKLDAPPVVREDIVRVGAGSTDLRYRPEFWPWSARITAIVDTELLSEQDVISLVNRAGFSVGVGEWRPERGGEFGRFKLDETQPVETTPES